MVGFKIDFGGGTERLDRRGVERKAGMRENSTFPLTYLGEAGDAICREGKSGRRNGWGEKEPRHRTWGQSLETSKVSADRRQTCKRKPHMARCMKLRRGAKTGG